MRHNAAAIVDAIGLDSLAERAAISAADASAVLSRFEDVEAVPQSDAEARLDEALVRAAIDTAIARHAGTLETVYTAQGPVQMQRGKDLSEVRWLIGTGGAVVHARDPARVLRVACSDAHKPHELRPRAPQLALDADYLLYAAGLLAQVNPQAAFDCARRHLRIVDTNADDERSR